MSEENKSSEQNFDFGACMGYAVENLVFLLGMALMFAKTVDLMSAFAPKQIFGYAGVEGWYGLAVGCLIEGALLVMKLLLPRAKNVIDWMWNVVVVVLPFLISALCQVFDSFQVRETLAQQPPEIQVFFNWFVPSVPTIIMALMIGKSIFTSMPDNMMPKGMKNARQAGGQMGFPTPKWSWNPFKWGRKESVNPIPASTDHLKKQ